MPTPPLPNIRRVTTIKILGINISNNLSVCGRVNNVIASCAQSAQSIHALRILRSHGIPKNSIYMIFKAVIIGKLTYAPSAWWGFTTANDRQRLESVIRRGIRSELCAADQTSLADLVEDADDNLFNRILYNNEHVLNRILPTKTE